MSNEQVNRLQAAIDKKANFLAEKEVAAFNQMLCRNLSANLVEHIYHKIKTQLPIEYKEQHIKDIVRAMQETVKQQAFNRLVDSELQNISSMLAFMREYQD